MGEPAYPVKEETELIKSAAYPLVQSAVINPEGDKAELSISVKNNGVVYFELSRRNFTPDRGYDYERALKA
jgi:xylan 1,4-beta-xylosidase